jgi:serine protease Do
MNMPGFVKRAAVALVAAASVATAGALALGHPFSHTLAAETAPAKPSAPPAAGTPVRALPDFAAIVKQYGPAVVNVSTVGGGATAEDDSGNGGPDEEQQPHRFGFPPFMIPHGNGGQMVRGIGSGFIVKSDGLILTNAHVVRGATEVTVRLTDRREFKAKVLGQDRDTDVAVLKINATNLPTVRIGDASKVQVGEWALAIGSPFGFENTATSGIISARARSLGPEERYVPFLQTDVPVNPGNSGGPLFNLQGEVIGINSQIYSGSGGYMGISFAIPINVAMKVQQQLVAGGKVVRGYLGVGIQDVTAGMAQTLSLPRPEGALIREVDPNGPSAGSELKSRDVILAVNGEPVDSSTDLPPKIADIAPGQAAKLTIWRDGKQREVTVKVGTQTNPKVAAAESAGGSQQGKLGLQVRPLTPQERSQAEVKGGVLVQGVSGPAARAGIQPGDVVLAAGGTPVSNVDQLKSLVGKAKGAIDLLVQRGDAKIFIPIELG